MSRISFADEETLSWMARAGCHMICYGVESADETILKNLRKDLKVEDVRPVVDMTRRAGISVRLSLMLDSPGETTETMEKTLRIALDVDPDLAQFNIATPYPGTEMFAWAEENGYLLHHDREKYDLRNVVMDLPTVTAREVSDFYRIAHRRFFLRPSFAIRLTRSLLRLPRFLLRSMKSYMQLLVTLLLPPNK